MQRAHHTKQAGIREYRTYLDQISGRLTNK
jgi:hypothetical protein